MRCVDDMISIAGKAMRACRQRILMLDAGERFVAAQRQSDRVLGGNYITGVILGANPVQGCRLGHFTPSSSTSKISVAFGGMMPPAPRAP